MRICGFLQNLNGVENGYLRLCLRSMAMVADDIVVYDDASDEDVRPVYEEFGCVVLYGRERAFRRELLHKQQLLSVAVRHQPDWIVWFDSDAVLGRAWETRAKTEAALDQAAAQRIDILELHNLNLWRSPWWYRCDQSFNDLWHGVWWRNTGELWYQPVARLHQKQFPHSHRDPDVPAVHSKFPDADGCLLHFGFARDEEIARKYFTYRGDGQSGWALDRLVSETTMVNPQTGKEEAFTLEPVESAWMPSWLLEHLPEPKAAPEPVFAPEAMAACGGLSQWRAWQKTGQTKP